MARSADRDPDLDPCRYAPERPARLCLHPPEGGADHQLDGHHHVCYGVLHLLCPRHARHGRYAQRHDPQRAEQVVFRNTFRIDAVPLLSKIPVLGPILFQKAYVTTYLGILVLIVTAFILKRTRFGLRLRSCGENPQAADSVGISVYKMRYSGVLISGALAGLGGLVFILPTTTTYTASVSGYGFLAMSVVVFGQWKPWGIALGALFFGLTKTIAASYSVIPFLYNLGIPEAFFKMLPYVATLIVLAFSTKRSNAPGVIGVPYDKSKR